MKIDLFCGFSRMRVDGYLPSETEVFANLVEQVQLADELGFGTAWIGEAHFALREEQQKTPPLLPHFPGEMCLNTDVLHLAHHLFARSQRIQVGSAIRNILCNGGPIAHAEAVRTFLTLHGLKPGERRKLCIGFGTGRFEFANAPYGLRPRNPVEKAAWPALRGLILLDATEIFLRLLRGDALASTDLEPRFLTRALFRTDEEWAKVSALAGCAEKILVEPFWTFERLRLIPEDAPMHLLDLIVGSHDASVQAHANRFLPAKVFNLSVTPPQVIDATHARMAGIFHAAGGPWKRSYMPRTIMIVVEDDAGLTDAELDRRGEARAFAAMTAYWQAMEGTVDEAKVRKGMENVVHGSPRRVAEELNSKFDPGDTLMAWFDFNDNDQARILRGMRTFARDIAPRLAHRDG